MEESLQNKFKAWILQILERTHTSAEKQQIKDMPGRLNLACPVCLDSINDVNKKRGNLYWDTLQYHCFNCGAHIDGWTLIKSNGIKPEDPVDTIKILDYIHQNRLNVETVDTFQYGKFKKIHESSFTREDIKEHFGFFEIPINPAHEAFIYLKNRLITKFDDLLWSPSDKRIIILNTTLDDRIIGFQARSILSNAKTKYLTYHLARIQEKMGINSDIADDNSYKNISTLFGSMRVNFQETVTVLEGPFDAMFVKNSLALTGINKNTTHLDEVPSIRYLFDNDEIGKKLMIEKIKNGKSVFLWNKILDEINPDKYIKDLNDLVVYAFQKSLKLKNLNQYFSTSKMDAYFI